MRPRIERIEGERERKCKPWMILTAMQSGKDCFKQDLGSVCVCVCVDKLEPTTYKASLEGKKKQEPRG